MSIATVYVMGKTKKALNEMIAINESGYQRCTQYHFQGSEQLNLFNMPTGTVIKIYSKLYHGSPVAKAYGTWDATKKRIK